MALYPSTNPWVKHTLYFTPHTFTMRGNSKSALGGKFQIWCSQFGITDEESMCLFMAKENCEGFDYLSGQEINTIAAQASTKLPVFTETVDLTNFE